MWPRAVADRLGRFTAPAHLNLTPSLLSSRRPASAGSSKHSIIDICKYAI